MSSELYDELDPLYRKLWGTSLHHGLWISGKESSKEAKKQLIEQILGLIEPCGQVADIGCGYGSFSLILAQQLCCEVHGYTLSARQAELIPDHPRIQVACEDWLNHQIVPKSLDQAFAIESVSHMANWESFSQRTHTVLKEGGELLIADWFGSGRQSPILKHLADAGRIPLWRTKKELLRTLTSRGLVIERSLDLSMMVARTWLALFKKSLTLPLREPNWIPPLLTQAWKRPELVWSFPLIYWAYRSRLLEYHLIKLKKA